MKLLLFCNSVFLLYSLNYFIHFNDFLLSLCINLMIFILPGLAWLAVFRLDRDADKVIGIFYIVLISAATFISGTIVHFILKIGITSLSQFLYIVVITNTGIILTKFPRADKKQPPLLKTRGSYLILTIIFFIVYVGAYFSAAYLTPALEDNDLELQGTAFGLLKSGAPYLLTDRRTVFHLAHPLLIHFYTANTILFSGQLEGTRYYYDTAIKAKTLLEKQPRVGETYSFINDSGLKIKAKIIAIDEDLLTFDRSLPEKLEIDYGKSLSVKGESLNVNTFKKHMIWQMVAENKAYFEKNPRLLATRMPNIFFTGLTAVIFFLLLLGLTESKSLSFVSVMLYFSFPEIFVLSPAGFYCVITNFSLLVLAYCYLKEYQINKTAPLSVGAFAAISNHETLIFPLTLMVRNFFAKSKIRKTFTSPIIKGFILGMAIFWAYGLLIDAKIFLLDHLRYHFFDRIFHIKTLDYGGYYSFFQLWKKFIYNLGWPFLCLSALSLTYIMKGIKNSDRRQDIIFFWFLTGAIVFSLVDWKDTAHLLYIIAPLVMACAIFISRQNPKARLLFFSILFFSIARNLWFIARIKADFRIIEPLSGW